ncbi:MAG: hypothetical protein CSA62_04175 [Planctomycetota bacterium]|nr:MAG: hypothetical protein CSA62_04175 [Planctomycetota bacterium]
MENCDSRGGAPLSQLQDPVPKHAVVKANTPDFAALAALVQSSHQGPNAGSALSLRQSLEALFRGKWFVLGMTVLGTLIGVWLGLSKPNQYESVASFHLRPGAEDIRIDPASNPEQSLQRYALRDNAEAILLSEELLRRVVRKASPETVLAPYAPRLRGNARPGWLTEFRKTVYALQRWLHSGGEQPNEQEALLALQRRLQIEAPENSDLLRVHLTGNDAEGTQELLRVFMQAAQARHQEVYDAGPLIELIEQRYAESRKRHDKARKELRAFLEKHGIRNFREDFAQSQMDVRESERAIANLKRKIDGDVLILEGLRKQLAETPRQIKVREQVPIANPRTNLLRTRIANHEAELEQLLGQVKDTDLAVVRLRATLTRLRADLANEEKKPTRYRFETRFENNSAWSDLRTRIVTLETQQRIDRRQIPERKQHLEQVKARNQELNSLSARYHQLADELATQSEELESARHRQQIAATKRELDARRLSSLQIFDQPSLPLEKIGPQRSRIVIGGFLGGLFAAIAFLILGALTDRKIHSAEEIEKQLGIKVLATVPNLDRSSLRRHHRQRVTSWH